MNVEVLPRRDLGGDPPGADPRPVVALPNPGLPGIAIAVVAAICAVLLFVMLDAQRRSAGSDVSSSDGTQTSAFAPPPPLVVPPEPILAPPVVTIQPEPAPVPPPRMAAPVPVPAPSAVVMAPAPPTVAPSAPVQTDSRLNEPALIYDFGAAPGEAGKVQPAQPPGPQPAAGAASPPAASRVQTPARTTRIANPTTVVPSGTLIKAVLETPIDTSRPGLARAIVSRDTRGFDGRQVLIPRGSRLIGEYESEVRTGQSKVLVNWTQLVRPDGSVIRLDSPAADALGGAGVPGRVNTFFFQRFANALMQTALTVGGSLAVWNADAPVVVGLPNTVGTAVTGQGNSLVGQTPQPRIKVKQGTAFNVFVARDLDFSSAPLRR